MTGRSFVKRSPARRVTLWRALSSRHFWRVERVKILPLEEATRNPWDFGNPKGLLGCNLLFKSSEVDFKHEENYYTAYKGCQRNTFGVSRCAVPRLARARSNLLLR